MKLSQLIKKFFVTLTAWSAIPGRKFDQSGTKGMIITFLIAIAFAFTSMKAFGQSEMESLIIFLISTLLIGWFIWIAPAITKSWYQKEYMKADEALRRYLTDDLICIYLLTGHSVGERVQMYVSHIEEQRRSFNKDLIQLEELKENKENNDDQISSRSEDVPTVPE